jgi:hypothetical protein
MADAAIYWQNDGHVQTLPCSHIRSMDNSWFTLSRPTSRFRILAGGKLLLLAYCRTLYDETARTTLEHGHVSTETAHHSGFPRQYSSTQRTDCTMHPHVFGELADSPRINQTAGGLCKPLSQPRSISGLRLSLPTSQFPSGLVHHFRDLSGLHCSMLAGLPIGNGDATACGQRSRSRKRTENWKRRSEPFVCLCLSMMNVFAAMICPVKQVSALPPRGFVGTSRVTRLIAGTFTCLRDWNCTCLQTTLLQ